MRYSYEDLGLSDEEIKEAKKWEKEHPFKKSRRLTSKKYGRKGKLTGIQFGLLTPIKIAPGINDYGYRWYCKCHCGKITNVSATCLIKGEVKSCGCLHGISNIERCWKGFGELNHTYWATVKASAAVRNIALDISIDYAWFLFLKQDRRCALSGLELQFARKGLIERDPGQTASLDRIDSAKGYVSGNVQWVHKDINYIKQDYDEKYFLSICSDVAVFSKKDFVIEPLPYFDSISDDDLINKYGVQKVGLTRSKQLWKGAGEYSIGNFTTLKRHAQDRGLSVSISMEDIWKRYLEQGGRCALSGREIKFSRNKSKAEQTASVDRIDSRKGYELDNIQIVHKDINMMKWDLDQNTFVDYCVAIHEGRGRDKFPISIVAISGGYDPVHVGHLLLAEEAEEYGLVVAIVNSDEWLIRKKGFYFQDFDERKRLVEAQKPITAVVSVDDSDGTVCEALRRIRPDYFAKGADRIASNVPEVEVCKELGIEILWEMGGSNKAQSSSDLIQRVFDIYTEKNQLSKINLRTSLKDS